METMALGLLAFTIPITSICCLHYKKPIGAIVCGIAVMVFSCLTAYYWKQILIASGKNVTMLGFNRYPAAVIILAALMIGALIVLVIGTISALRERRGA